MSNTQGQRLVRDYASQFETLLGRLDSYDESMMLNQFIWGLQLELARSVSLHYPKSITQAVSLAETTELAVKASRRPATKTGSIGNGQKGPSTSNRGRGYWRGGTRRGQGQEVERGIMVEEIEDRVGEEEEHLDQPDLTRWHAIGAGFVAIWPMTVPKPGASREELAKVALPEEHLPDPGKKAHKEDEDEVVRCDSGPSMCCMMRTGIHIPWMMQVNYTSP